MINFGLKRIAEIKIVIFSKIQRTEIETVSDLCLERLPSRMGGLNFERRQSPALSYGCVPLSASGMNNCRATVIMRCV